MPRRQRVHHLRNRRHRSSHDLAALTDYSKVDIPASRYKSVNFPAPKRPGTPNCRAPIVCERARRSHRARVLPASPLPPPGRYPRFSRGKLHPHFNRGKRAPSGPLPGWEEGRDWVGVERAHPVAHLFVQGASIKLLVHTRTSAGRLVHTRASKSFV